jgi:hypothetical protein
LRSDSRRRRSIHERNLAIDIDNGSTDARRILAATPGGPRAKAILDIEGMDWDRQPPLRYLLARNVKNIELDGDGCFGLKGERWPAVVAGNYGTRENDGMLDIPGEPSV